VDVADDRQSALHEVSRNFLWVAMIQLRQTEN